MHIINAFLRYTSLGAKRLGTLVGFSDPTDNSENQPLLHDDDHPNATLTSEYHDFAHSHSALKLCVAHVLIYFLLAVIGFSTGLVEHWSVIDSIYYGTVVFTTIGYGDKTPSTNNGQLFTIVLAIYGIVILGIFLGVIGEIVVDYQNAASLRQHQQISEKVLAKLVVQKEAPDPRLRGTEESNREVPQQKSILQEIWSVFILELPIILVLVLIAFCVGRSEGWGLTESFYWVVITGTTVGFGDYAPKNESDRLFCIFFLPFVVAVLGELLARIASAYLDRKRRQTEITFMNRSLAMCDIERMDTNSDGRVEKADFLSYMLVALQKVSKEDCDEIMALFKKLDIDNNNCLTKEDLINKDWAESMKESFRVLNTDFD